VEQQEQEQQQLDPFYDLRGFAAGKNHPKVTFCKKVTKVL